MKPIWNYRAPARADESNDAPSLKPWSKPQVRRVVLTTDVSGTPDSKIGATEWTTGDAPGKGYRPAS